MISFFYKNLIILFLFLVFSEILFSQNIPFKAGEHTEYKIYFGAVWVGSSTLEVKNGVAFNGKKSYHIIGTGKTAPFCDWFFKVRDLYETHIDQQSVLPIEFIRNVNEGGYLINQHYLFNHLQNKVSSGDSTYYISDFTQDMLSAFFYARTFSKDVLMSSPKNTFEIPIFVDEESYNIKVSYLGNQLIETNWGRVDCMVFKPFMQQGRVFENEEEMKIWVTDDENRILVRVETTIWAGTIRAELNNYNNLKSPIVFIN